jgi:hypothetical protein
MRMCCRAVKLPDVPQGGFYVGLIQLKLAFDAIEQAWIGLHGALAL